MESQYSCLHSILSGKGTGSHDGPAISADGGINRKGKPTGPLIMKTGILGIAGSPGTAVPDITHGNHKNKGNGRQVQDAGIEAMSTAFAKSGGSFSTYSTALCPCFLQAGY